MKTAYPSSSVATLTTGAGSSPYFAAMLTPSILMLPKHDDGAPAERIPMRLSFHRLWFTTYQWRAIALAPVISMLTAIGMWWSGLAAVRLCSYFPETAEEAS